VLKTLARVQLSKGVFIPILIGHAPLELNYFQLRNAFPPRGRVFAPIFLPALATPARARKKDFHVTPSCGFPLSNLTFLADLNMEYYLVKIFSTY